MKTVVKFLAHQDDEGLDIYAIFPNHPANFPMIEAYTTEMHTSVDGGYIEESRDAKPTEYAPLLEELQSVGYDLEILNDPKPLTFLTESGRVWVTPLKEGVKIDLPSGFVWRGSLEELERSLKY